jgi:hypothetical protein
MTDAWVKIDEKLVNATNVYKSIKYLKMFFGFFHLILRINNLHEYGLLDFEWPTLTYYTDTKNDFNTQAKKQMIE